MTALLSNKLYCENLGIDYITVHNNSNMPLKNFDSKYDNTYTLYFSKSFTYI